MSSARYANGNRGQAQTLVNVGSNPPRACPARREHAPVGGARRTACKAVALAGKAGSTPARGTGGCEIERHGSFFQRPGCQVVNLAMGVRFPYEPLGGELELMEVRRLTTARSSSGSGRQILNLQTGVRVPHGSLRLALRTWGLSCGDVDQLGGVATLRTWTVWVRIPPSLLADMICRRAGARPGLISLDAGFDSQVCNCFFKVSVRNRANSFARRWGLNSTKRGALSRVAAFYIRACGLTG